VDAQRRFAPDEHPGFLKPGAEDDVLGDLGDLPVALGPAIRGERRDPRVLG
jgi:hypothetical protein